MKLEHHIALSTIISGILFAIFKSWGLTIAAFISGVFIDLDHIIDYVMEHGFRYNSKRFFNFFYEERHKKITLVFHAWEWLVILGIIAALTNWNPWVIGVFIGFGQHLILDCFFNHTPILTYSFLWRWKNGFESETIFPRDRGYNPKKHSNR